MNCKKCGKELLGDANFCTNCGAKIAGEGTVDNSMENNIDIKETVENIKEKSLDMAKTIANKSADLAAKVAANENVQKVAGKVTSNENVQKVMQNENVQKAKSIVSKNKKIVLAVLACLVLLFGFSAFRSTPEKTMKKFCKSISNFKVTEALELTNFKSAMDMLGNNGFGSIMNLGGSQAILEMEKELKTEFKKIEIKVKDMKKIVKKDDIAVYDVTLKMKAVDSYGDKEEKERNEEMTFVKHKGKWLIDISSNF